MSQLTPTHLLIIGLVAMVLFASIGLIDKPRR